MAIFSDLLPGTIAALAFTAVATVASAHPTPAAGPVSAGPVGEAVSNIRFARLIDSFTALDNKRIVHLA